MSTGAGPSVSVIVPTYNRRRTLGRALDSVGTQTWPAREVIVVDDGSRDGTAEWLPEAHPDVRLIPLTRNLGAAHARNVAMREATGDIIAFLDSDDWWEPGFLQESVAALQRAPEAVMAVSDVHMMLLYEDAPSQYVYRCRPVHGYRDMVEHLLLHNFITTMSCVAVRRPAVEAVGLLDETLRVVHDKEWYIRLSTRGGVACTEQPLVWRNIDKDNLVADLDRFLADNKRFWSLFFTKPPGAGYRDLRWRVRSKTYEGFAAMALGRGSRLASCRYNLMGFMYSCYDMHPELRLLRRAGEGFHAALRAAASKALRRRKR